MDFVPKTSLKNVRFHIHLPNTILRLLPDISIVRMSDLPP